MEIDCGFYNDPAKANSFFDVQRAVYPHLDLEWASRQHLLQTHVTPFAIFNDEGRAVSILNATKMEVLIAGKTLRAIQIGTVATLPEYRGRGLAGKLQRHVQTELASRFDLTFLFANPSVVDFYPKFGFQRIQQTAYRYEPKRSSGQSFTKLELNDDGISFLKEMLMKRDRLSNVIDACHAEWLAEFYCRKIFPSDLWVDSKRQILAVATIEDNIMELHDVIAPKLPVNFFQNFPWPGISEVRIGFTPDRFEGSFQTELLPIEDSIFVNGNFPKIHSAFKFPTLAQT